MSRVSRIFLILCVSLTTGKPLSAQFFNQRPEFINANRVWIFGWQAGLDFNVSPPLSFQSPLIVGEGVSAASDPVSGSLLFYSDGRMVRDRNHNIMPNGSGITGNNGSTTQGVCIVALPGDPDRYLLFSLEYEGDPGRLYYSEIDLSLNNGLGDVMPGRKNIQIDSNLGEAMIAVPGDNCDVWLIVHTRAEPVFKAYRITAAGLNTVPVISNTGALPISGHRGSGARIYPSFAYCLMQVSPGRDRIATGTVHYNYPPGQPGAPPITGVMLCRFDPANGNISDPLLITDTPTCNFSFSPGDDLFYLTKPDPANHASVLYQYDISSYDHTAITASEMLIGSISNVFSPANYQDPRMRLYNDTIFLGNYQSGTIHRINRPDLRGVSCDLQMDAIALPPGTFAIGNFPSDVIHSLPPDTIEALHDTTICQGQALAFSAPGQTNILWNDGSTDPVKNITAPGNYYVFSKTGCHFRADTFHVQHRNSDTTGQAHPDMIICNNAGSVSLHAPPGYTSYLWNTGDTGSALLTADRGSFRVYSGSDCYVRIDSFRVDTVDVRFSLGADIFLCKGDSATFTIPVAGIYKWQDGSNGRGFTATVPGIYMATVSNRECRWSDTIRVKDPGVPQSLGPDQRVCMEDEIHITLRAGIPEGTPVLWSDGTREPTIEVRDTGTYWVKVCTDTDTIRITRGICTCSVNLPDAFTPNGDGLNDIFRAVFPPDCPVQQFRMDIYDRWGAQVFSTSHPGEGWDGKYNGAPASVGVYTYFCHYEQAGKRKQQKGMLHLIL